MKNTGFINIPFFLLILSIVLCFFIRQNLSIQRDAYLAKTYMDYTFPSKITGVAALEFKGIVSDFLFLKMSTFLGEKFIKQEKLGNRHQEYIYNSVDAITDLDPWFWDAYLVANMLLTWDFKEFAKANTLLLKAREYRDNDFKPPYYIGFNYFYFLKDNANGAKYLMEAAKLPGAPRYFYSLATRLAMYQNQYGPAIMFLNDVIKSTQNSELKKKLEKRLQTLLIMDRLEKKVDEYKIKYGVYPEMLRDLVDVRILESIPVEPYGGKFILLENKRVYTTSKMRATEKNK